MQPIASWLMEAESQEHCHVLGDSKRNLKRRRKLVETTRQFVKEIKSVPTGTAAIMPWDGGCPKCRFIIHAVGPKAHAGSKAQQQTQLVEAIRQLLTLAEKHKVKTLALPAISSGVYGFPKDLCAHVIVKEVKE